MRRPPKDPGAAMMLKRLNKVTPTISRAMFSGYGYYTVDGPMYAMFANGRGYFKADSASIEEFEREGGAPFVYEGARGPTAIGYYCVPDSAWESTRTLQKWVDLAIEAAARAQKGNR